LSILINAYSTCHTQPELAFPHHLNAHRDLQDPELAGHLNGFQGYILKTGGDEMTQNKYHLLRHIQRVKHHFSFEVEQSNFEAMSKWASKSNVVMFFPDGTIRSATGSVLFYPDGQSPDKAAQVPFLADSYSRRSRTDAFLSQSNISVPSLPPLPCEYEIELRSTQEIFHRTLSLFAVAVRAESMATSNPIEIATLKERLPGGFLELSPLEGKFMADDAPEDSQVAQFGWRYEGVALLLWSLNMLPELPFPSAICDVPKLAKITWGWSSWQDKIELRSVSEILNCLDLHYELHWLVRQAGINKEKQGSDIDAGVVLERHYALNWLTKFENADWDSVDTPT